MRRRRRPVQTNDGASALGCVLDWFADFLGSQTNFRPPVTQAFRISVSGYGITFPRSAKHVPIQSNIAHDFQARRPGDRFTGGLDMRDDVLDWRDGGRHFGWSSAESLKSLKSAFARRSGRPEGLTHAGYFNQRSGITPPDAADLLEVEGKSVRALLFLSGVGGQHSSNALTRMSTHAVSFYISRK